MWIQSLQKVRTMTGDPCTPIRRKSRDLETTLLARAVGHQWSGAVGGLFGACHDLKGKEQPSLPKEEASC